MMKTLVVFLVIFMFISFSNTVFAIEIPATISAQIKESDHIANIKERLSEKITLFFKFNSNSKADYQTELANKRLAELVYVIKNKKGNFIEETSSRYSTYVGRLTETIVSNKLSGKKDDILKTMDAHLIVLKELNSSFEAKSVFRLLMEHDINYLKLYRTKIENL